MPKKEKQGIVVSNKMDKTVVVKVASYDPHPKYKKIIESNKNYKAHDEQNVCGEGDIVRIVESRPISGGKRWTVVEVVEKDKIIEKVVIKQAPVINRGACQVTVKRIPKKPKPLITIEHGSGLVVGVDGNGNVAACNNDTAVNVNLKK